MSAGAQSSVNQRRYTARSCTCTVGIVHTPLVSRACATERRPEMAHPAPFSKTKPLHWHALSLRCSTLLYNSLRHPTHARNSMPILGVAASDRHATLHDCTLVYDTHDTVHYYTLRNPCGASRHDHGVSTPWDGLRSGSVATGCA